MSVDALMNMFYPTVSMLYVDEQEILLSAKYISELGEKTIYLVMENQNEIGNG